MDIVELCKKYRQQGVVGIDLAGDESLNCDGNPDHRKAYEVRAVTSTENCKNNNCQGHNVGGRSCYLERV